MPTGTTVNQETVSTLTIQQEIEIAAPIEIAFDSVLALLGPEGVMDDGSPFAFTLEAWPGGRWFRDLGASNGHLWGHVQVIKRPKLLEIWGPMMMSTSAVNHLQYRLTADGSRTRLQLTHRAMGLIDEQHRVGLPKGFQSWLKHMKERAEKKASK